MDQRKVIDMSFKQFMKSKSIKEYREAKKDSVKMSEIEKRSAGQVLKNAIADKPKQPNYAAQLRAKQEVGLELTEDEQRTLAAIDAGATPTAPHCAKCKSTNIQLLGQNRKAFSVGKAVAGGVLTGGVGTIAGFAGKKGKYEWLCMNCGNRFTIK